MYDYNTVLKGLVKFVDCELVPKMTGLSKWVIGTGAGIIASKGAAVFESLKKNELLHQLELIEDSKINVSLLYKELIRQAEHGAIQIDIPMVGVITLDRKDVDQMYRYIIED